MGGLNNDEFDSVFELVITVLFMAFGIFATATSMQYLNSKIALIERSDKIKVTHELDEVQDPFYFTGYQAYMFAWHMDDLSEVDLTWCSDESPIDTNSPSNVTIGVKDENDAYRQAFIAWRNRTIVGTGYATERNVKKVIARASGGNMYNHYRGLDGSTRYHLEFTGDYTTRRTQDLESHRPERKFKWILIPRT